MTQFQIKNGFTDEVQFECKLTIEIAKEDYGVQLGFAVKKAIKAGVSLRGSNLSYSNLRGSDLRGSDLSYSNLSYSNLRDSDPYDDIKLIGERPVLSIGPIGSRQDTLLAFNTDKGIYVRAGCFFDTLQAFKEKVAAKHEFSKFSQEYAACFPLIELRAELWKGETP